MQQSLSLSQDSLASQRRISVKYPSGGGWRRRGGSQRSGRRRGGFRRLLHLCRVNAAANRSRVRGCPPPREKGKNVDPGLAVGGGGENLLMGWWRPAEWIAPAGWSAPRGGSVRVRTAALPGSVWSRLPSRYSTSGWPQCTPGSHLGPDPGLTYSSQRFSRSVHELLLRRGFNQQWDYVQVKEVQELHGVYYFHQQYYVSSKELIFSSDT